MSKRRPIKETVKVLYITKPNQKIRFQIRHPENVYAITGIAVTCTLAAKRRGKMKLTGGSNAGTLHLAIAEKGDVAFTEDVKVDTNNYAESTEEQISVMGISKGISFEGKRLSYFQTHFKITDAIMEGYYWDSFLTEYGFFINTESVFADAIQALDKSLVIIPSEEIIPIKDSLLYKVTVYIRYSTIKPEEK